ncbi:MAG: ECF transporter S component [Armatimonadota bacterium]|nr:ECF transporter S component [Armatimonadota bacterium]MDR7438670.1 ECF transporter S component [Armatimonadota bacterium]MDR7563767.1 ECF transporter S component [Armatimonadota bacterium]MDR7567933.1 ECF transporter S component [Armatimonadota bacterium]MDR7601813.1 ECF transporter S component [Armatimonadota bacterium]
MQARNLTVVGMLGALSAVMGLVPGIGFIPAPTPAGAATTMHLPAILAGITRGPVAGALVGAVFGFFSFSRATLPFFKDPLIAFGPRVLIGVLAAYTFAALSRRAARGVAAVACGAAVYTVLGPGARAFEAAFTGGKVQPSWLVNLYHAVASTAASHPLAAFLGGLGVAALAYLLLRGEAAPVAAAAVVGTLTNTVGVLGLIVWRFPQLMPPGAAVAVGATHGLPEALLAVVVTVPVYRALRSARLV